MSDRGSTVDISPGVSILGVLSHLNYEPWYALSEYVDNAVQSARADREALVEADPGFNLMVDVEIDPTGTGVITIVDNAGGIHRDDFARAFRAAEVPPDRSGLSEFGMGMKSASIWFARKWAVETTSVGDVSVYTVRFDMDEVLRGNSSDLVVTTSSTDAKTHYTKIVLSELNQVPRGRTLGKIRDHMRDIYRTFLRSGELRLTVAGERMAFRDPVVLRAVDARQDADGGEVQTWLKDVAFELSPEVRVTGFAALREEGSTKDAGFALFRRGRSIIGSGDTPYRPASIYGGGNSYRSQRLFGELHVDGLPVSHTKDGFQWGEFEELFLSQLRNQLDEEPLPLLKQAEGYRSRTMNRQQARFILAATESTARSMEANLPEILEEVVGPVVTELEEDAGNNSSTRLAQPVSTQGRLVEFEHDGKTWRVSVAAVQNAPAARWLSSAIDHGVPGETSVTLNLNASHPFITQFALGDRDSFEAVLRMAVALVVAESLAIDAGVPYTRILLDRVNTVLTKALSTK
ncbi:ATP-binding protein [Labedella populi]|uniref:ATP-binding protein n=1 Tax=Labedella populi TaxID=2498850 RepID=A0A3S4E724_9MICO|nr:ATP-binding protein [Labedella populi]